MEKEFRELSAIQAAVNSVIEVPGMPGLLTINGWSFCASHGREWCPSCTTDHRSNNNTQLEDNLSEHQMEILTDYGLEDLADRQQITVTNDRWERVPYGVIDLAVCREHRKVCCNDCFNFNQQIIDRIPALEAKMNAEIEAFKAKRQQQQQQPSSVTPAAAAAVAAAAEPSRPAEAQQTSTSGTSATEPGPAAGADKACWQCSKHKSAGVKLRFCSRCHRAMYCSQECQKAHYPTHRPQCKQWAEEAES